LATDIRTAIVKVNKIGILLIGGIAISILASWFVWLIMQPHVYIGEKLGDVAGKTIASIIAK
jgi:hypothetical protein